MIVIFQTVDTPSSKTALANNGMNTDAKTLRYFGTGYASR